MIGRWPGHPPRMTIPKGYLPFSQTTVFSRTLPSVWSLGAIARGALLRQLEALRLQRRRARGATGQDPRAQDCIPMLIVDQLVRADPDAASASLDGVRHGAAQVR